MLLLLRWGLRRMRLWGGLAELLWDGIFGRHRGSCCWLGCRRRWLEGWRLGLRDSKGKAGLHDEGHAPLWKWISKARDFSSDFNVGKIVGR